MGTHFSFLFSIYSENHGVQAEPLNFTRSSDITYVFSEWVDRPASQGGDIHFVFHLLVVFESLLRLFSKTRQNDPVNCSHTFVDPQ